MIANQMKAPHLAAGHPQQGDGHRRLALALVAGGGGNGEQADDGDDVDVVDGHVEAFVLVSAEAAGDINSDADKHTGQS